MDSPSHQKVVGPKQARQTFNILLHQALDEEQANPPGLEHRKIDVSPVSCPSKTLNRAEAWEPQIPPITTSLLPAEPASGEPVRVKFTRRRGPEARAMTMKPAYDSLAVHAAVLGPKLRTWKSVSDTETDDVEDELTHRRAKGTKKSKKKGERMRILGAVNLGLRPKQP